MKEQERNKLEIQVIQALKEQGYYSDSYLPIIQVYVDVLLEYRTLWDQYINEGMKSYVETANGDPKSNPLTMRLKTLRIEISKLANDLMLTPKSKPQTNNNITEEEKEKEDDKVSMEKILTLVKSTG